MSCIYCYGTTDYHRDPCPVGCKFFTQEEKIKNMFSYLKGDRSIREISNDVFQIEYNVDPEIKGYDIYFSTIDFIKKEISQYFARESHHNGDHYDCHNENLTWGHLPSIYNYLLNKTIAKAKVEVVQNLTDKMVNEKMKSILGIDYK